MPALTARVVIDGQGPVTESADALEVLLAYAVAPWGVPTKTAL